MVESGDARRKAPALETGKAPEDYGVCPIFQYIAAVFTAAFFLCNKIRRDKPFLY